MPFKQRPIKGSLVTWLLVLAIFGLAFVGCIIALEMLTKWVTLTRIKSAAQEAVVVYARDLIKGASD
jgi:hypothetical protein